MDRGVSSRMERYCRSRVEFWPWHFTSADLGDRALRYGERQKVWRRKSVGQSPSTDGVFLPHWDSRTVEWRDRIWKRGWSSDPQFNFCSTTDLTMWLKTTRFFSLVSSFFISKAKKLYRESSQHWFAISNVIRSMVWGYRRRDLAV